MRRTSLHISHILHGIVVLALAMTVASVGCRRTAPPQPTNVTAGFVTALPLDPMDKAWNAAPWFVAQLIPQDLVDPRMVSPSTREVRVQALSDGQELAVRLEWDDETQNDLNKPGAFSDACAIQLPAVAEPTVPAPQMGEPGRPVNFSYWNASWQSIVDGRENSIKSIYPNAALDHYPFEAKPLEKNPVAQREMSLRYSPASALGNTMPNGRESAVEDLMADGPGTLRAAPAKSKGYGMRTANGWAVVLQRPLPENFSSKTGTQIAFAVWNGENREVGSRKMRTGWIPLTLEEKP